MKAKQKIVISSVVCGSMAILGGLLNPGMYERGASALTWPGSGATTQKGEDVVRSQTGDGDLNVEFTFNSTLSIGLSSDELTIANLAPGQQLDSNEITITTTTTNALGYTLKASADKTSLENTSGASGSSFLSISNQNGAALTDGTWGYLVDGSNGATSYKGFANANTAVELKKTVSSAVSGDAVRFRIGAKAASNQASGTYSNTITFTSTANVDTAGN